MQFFETIFLKEADEFIQTLDSKIQKKLMYNIRVAEQTNDPRLFKKLNDNIWEFKTKFLGDAIRLLAFGDKTNKSKTLVVATNGFVKKTQKTPKKLIGRAEKIRKSYFDDDKK